MRTPLHSDHHRHTTRQRAFSFALVCGVILTGAADVFAGHVHDHRPVPGLISPDAGQQTPVYVHTLDVRATQRRVRTVMTLANPTDARVTLALGLPVKLSSFVRRFGMRGVDLDARDCATIARTKHRPTIRTGRRVITPALVVPGGQAARVCHVRWRWSVDVPARGRLRVVVTHAPSRFAEDDGQGFFLTMTELAASDHPEAWGRPIRRARVDVCGAGLARAILRTPAGRHFLGGDALQSVQIEHVLTPGARRDRRAGCVRWRYRAWRPKATDTITLAMRTDTRGHDMRLDPRSDEDITPEARARTAWCASGGLARGHLERRTLSSAELRAIEDDALRRLTSYPDRPDGTHSDAAIKARWRGAPPHARAHFRAEVARFVSGQISARLGAPPTRGGCAKAVRVETDVVKRRQLRANLAVVRKRLKSMETRHRKLARTVRRVRSAGRLLRHVPTVKP